MAHAVGAGVGDQHHVAFGGRGGQQAVAGRARRRIRRSGRPRRTRPSSASSSRLRLSDVVPGVVQRRAHQRVHAGVQRRRGARRPSPPPGSTRQQQHAGLGHQVAARLDHQARNCGYAALISASPARQRRRGRRPRRRACTASAGRRRCRWSRRVPMRSASAGQLGVHLAPVRGVVDAAAQVRVQADDAHAELARRGEERVEPRHRQAELGRVAAGAHLLVVAVAVAQVERAATASRPRNTSGQRCSASTLSRVTVTPRAERRLVLARAARSWA